MKDHSKSTGQKETSQQGPILAPPVTQRQSHTNQSVIGDATSKSHQSERLWGRSIEGPPNENA